MNAPQPSGPTTPTEAGLTQSERKHKAILDAATVIFLRDGYLGTSMDEVAAQAGVSKQTAYAHFATKEKLFVEIVLTMCLAAGNQVIDATPDPTRKRDVENYLQAYALRQLKSVMVPEVMRLRRLVIGEVNRFPELARTLHEYGPARAIATLAAVFKRLHTRGMLRIDAADVAASHFNWLVMGDPINKAMLLGDQAILAEREMREHANSAVRVFLSMYHAR
jgi:TetR/AcrR family transcriptional regulator, mexJK operon transcriptional repressor